MMWLQKSLLLEGINHGTIACHKAISRGTTGLSAAQNLCVVSYLYRRRNTSKLSSTNGKTLRSILFCLLSRGTRSQLRKTSTIRLLRFGSPHKKRIILITGLSYPLVGRRCLRLSQLLSTSILPSSMVFGLKMTFLPNVMLGVSEF